ncbi:MULTISPECIES: YhcH/YjgK/YiaL family protein [Pasteurellaceae]|uniref:YhcH/YjgK/YiaL family protein n=1 Tax=Pasteurellaceae TaxID=712 RepID=UPI0005098849
MFFGHITTMNPHDYPNAIQIALEYLSKTDFDKLAPGRYVLKQDAMYVQVLDLETKPKAENLPEIHRTFLDVQYLHAGKERIGVAPDLGTNEIATPYDAERDILFYKDAQAESELVMQPGSFAVFFPEDVHRPACIEGERGKIRKVVVKIAISEIRGGL